MTRKEFDLLPLREQVRMLQYRNSASEPYSELWNDISYEYDICLVSELDEYIGEAVFDCFDYCRWREVLARLSDLETNIGDTPDYDYVFRSFDHSAWYDFRPLTRATLSAMIDSRKGDPSYKEFFEPEHPEEYGLSFDGLEALI